MQFNYNPENAIGSADIVKLFFYIPSYVACLLVRSGCIEFYLHILQFNYNPENAIVLQFNYNPENTIGSADIVKLFFYIPSYVACLLARSGCIEFYLHILQCNYNVHVYTLVILPIFKISE